MRSLDSFRNGHEGDTIIVCGCGESLNGLNDPAKFITIGVNDVGRLFHPDYLVVVNPPEQFQGDRFHYVETSKAKYLFTQLDLGISKQNIVRFRLGNYGGTEFSNPHVLHYTQNSPYVAVCLAAYLGARHIGLIGVDFTANHFFANSGKHPLSSKMTKIDAEYRVLASALSANGIQVFNLSHRSCLTAFPKLAVTDFINRFGALNNMPQKPMSSTKSGIHHNSTTPLKRRKPMKIAVEKHNSGIVGDFMDAIAGTASSMGHTVTRNVMASAGCNEFLSVVWNGRTHRSAGPTLYCEHAWLPRWEYQISPRGINTDSHLAPFKWDGKPLGDMELLKLKQHIDTIRQRGPDNYTYMQTNYPPVTDLPDAFLLVPLQMEWDTNIQRHVPDRFRKMQSVVDYISSSNPPYPIVFKQHPADTRRGNQQLGLRLMRFQDLIRPHRLGNIHQILKTGHCKGIISLNSNVVHDGLIWDVPTIVLGNNIWPRHEPKAFMTDLPHDWADFQHFYNKEETWQCLEAYCWYLSQNQWKLSDVQDRRKVENLINSVNNDVSCSPNKLRSAPALVEITSKPLVNVVAINKGWFFEDAKRKFSSMGHSKARIMVSDKARRDADAWIYIRTHEAEDSPDPRRTVVQIHDMFDENLYRPGGNRRVVDQCAVIIFTHPDQKKILENSGVNLSKKKILTRPIGALDSFNLRKTLPGIFTIGWVGRSVVHHGSEIKRVEWLVDAVKKTDLPRSAFQVVFIGEHLEKPYQQLRAGGIACQYHRRDHNPIESYPAHYSKLDCIVITSREEAGPLCLFESLAAGIPVVSTPVGWSKEFIVDGETGYIFNDVNDLITGINLIYQNRRQWFDNRSVIRDRIKNYTMESWINKNIEFALDLTNNS